MQIMLSAALSPPSNAKPLKVPFASRLILKIGWNTALIFNPRSPSSLRIESTRNGLSSLTVTNNVTGASKLSRCSVGLKTRK